MNILNLTKLTTVTILAFSSIACSSGGNHTTQNTSPLVPEQTAAEKAEADRLAAEKAEADRLAAEKAEADRLAAEKTEVDRLAAEKAEADRLVAEKAEADRLAAEKVEADRLAAEKAEADRFAAEKAEADRFAAEKAEADRLAAEKVEADRLAAEKAEADRLAAEKAEADRLAAEKAEVDRLAAEKAAALEANRLVLLNKAKEAGLNDQQAAAYAEENKESDNAKAQAALDTLIINIEKAEVSAAKGISDNSYPIGNITANTSASASSTNNALTQESRNQSVVYNQSYSVVLGNYTGSISYNNQTGAIIADNRTSDIIIKGLKTTVDAIPTLGSATYTGKAFNGVYINTTTVDYSGMFPSIVSTSKLAEGTLNYNVNFTDRLGSGTITGLGNTIKLDQGSISGTGISSSAQQSYNSGTYSLDFYGKKAEEIAGKVILNGKDTVGFGGTRGEISK